MLACGHVLHALVALPSLLGTTKGFLHMLRCSIPDVSARFYFLLALLPSAHPMQAGMSPDHACDQAETGSVNARFSEPAPWLHSRTQPGNHTNTDLAWVRVERGGSFHDVTEDLTVEVRSLHLCMLHACTDCCTSIASCAHMFDCPLVSSDARLWHRTLFITLSTEQLECYTCPANEHTHASTQTSQPALCACSQTNFRSCHLIAPQKWHERNSDPTPSSSSTTFQQAPNNAPGHAPPLDLEQLQTLLASNPPPAVIDLGGRTLGGPLPKKCNYLDLSSSTLGGSLTLRNGQLRLPQGAYVRIKGSGVCGVTLSRVSVQGTGGWVKRAGHSALVVVVPKKNQRLFGAASDSPKAQQATVGNKDTDEQPLQVMGSACDASRDAQVMQCAAKARAEQKDVSFRECEIRVWAEEDDRMNDEGSESSCRSGPAASGILVASGASVGLEQTHIHGRQATKHGEAPGTGPVPAGVLVMGRGSMAHARDCSVSDCADGLSAVDGGQLVAEGCTCSENGGCGFSGYGTGQLTAISCTSAHNAGNGYSAYERGSVTALKCTASHNGGGGFSVFGKAQLATGSECCAQENHRSGYVAVDKGAHMEVGEGNVSVGNQGHGFAAASGALLETGVSCQANDNWLSGFSAMAEGQVAAGPGCTAEHNGLFGFHCKGAKALLLACDRCVATENNVGGYMTEAGGFMQTGRECEAIRNHGSGFTAKGASAPAPAPAVLWQHVCHLFAPWKVADWELDACPGAVESWLATGPNCKSTGNEGCGVVARDRGQVAVCSSSDVDGNALGTCDVQGRASWVFMYDDSVAGDMQMHEAVQAALEAAELLSKVECTKRKAKLEMFAVDVGQHTVLRVGFSAPDECEGGETSCSEVSES